MSYYSTSQYRFPIPSPSTLQRTWHAGSDIHVFKVAFILPTPRKLFLSTTLVLLPVRADSISVQLLYYCRSGRFPQFAMSPGKLRVQGGFFTYPS